MALRPRPPADEPRCCWVCLVSEEEEEGRLWVQPCRCSGTTRWVHQTCIQAWVDEKQQGSPLSSVSCPQCLTPYLIYMPRSPLHWMLYEVTDSLVSAVSPIAGVAVIASSLYVTAMAYGGLAVCQFVGLQDGLRFLNRLNRASFCVTLPLIPCALVLPRFVQPRISLVTRHEPPPNQHPRQPHIGVVGPTDEEWDEEFLDGEEGAAEGTGGGGEGVGGVEGQAGTGGEEGEVETTTTLEVSFETENNHMSLSRAVVGGLLFPSIAAGFGRLLFSRFNLSNFRRSCLGGLVYVIAKKAMHHYYVKNRTRRVAHRRVMDRPFLDS